MDIKKTANSLIIFTARRLAEIFGLFILFSGLLLFIALFTYSPEDPNFIFPDILFNKLKSYYAFKPNEDSFSNVLLILFVPRK